MDDRDPDDVTKGIKKPKDVLNCSQKDDRNLEPRHLHEILPRLSSPLKASISSDSEGQLGTRRQASSFIWGVAVECGHRGKIPKQFFLEPGRSQCFREVSRRADCPGY